MRHSEPLVRLAEVACSDRADIWWGVDTVNFAVLENVDYYVFVDGYVDEWHGLETKNPSVVPAPNTAISTPH